VAHGDEPVAVLPGHAVRGMPYDIAERNIRSIARLLPEVGRWPDSVE
jgi:hypothetical protein